MTLIRFACTVTGHVLETELKSDNDTLKVFREHGLWSRCCFCAGSHRWELSRKLIQSEIVVRASRRTEPRNVC
jgi:hypothetical protein